MFESKLSSSVSSKKIHCTIGSGRKGKLSIQKTQNIRKRAGKSNLQLARAALKRKREEEVMTPPSISTNGTQSTSGMSSLTQESTRYKKHGVSFDDFIEDNKDWRSFGSITFEGMKENGYVDILLKKISIYNNARTNKAKYKAVICSSELPLSEAASRLLDTKMTSWYNST